jgi:F-type H+-transporting ATPase subunit a
VIEGLYKYATGLSGSKKAKDFFPLFMTLILYILVANWIELIPGVDSVGFYEYIPHLEAEKTVHEAEQLAEKSGTHLSEEEIEEIEHEAEAFWDARNEGDFRAGPFLILAPDNGIEGDVDENDARAGRDPDNADWAVTAFLRAPATDLNFTLAMALVTMFLVQFYGFKYLGVSYLKKFIPWDSNVDAMAQNPIKAIDWIVGILEIVGEFSRILSFSFRLLGNIFAGQVLLFVIASLVPVISVAFFGLEFFVAIIQAVVFGLLALMFMSGATEQHGDDDHHD